MTATTLPAGPPAVWPRAGAGAAATGVGGDGFGRVAATRVS